MSRPRKPGLKPDEAADLKARIEDAMSTLVAVNLQVERHPDVNAPNRVRFGRRAMRAYIMLGRLLDWLDSQCVDRG